MSSNPLCENDIPYVDYSIQVVGGASTPLANITWIRDDGSNSVAQTLVDQPLNGRLLWPGTELGADGIPINWPGWQLLSDGSYQQVSDGLRPTMTLLFEVNPSEAVSVTYPASTADCSPNPPCPSGQRDECGVCDGDNRSCLECESFDITQSQLALDGNANEHAFLVRRAATQLIVAARGDKRAVRFAKQTRAQANELAVEIWRFVWGIPGIVTSCNASVLCVTVSNVGTIQSTSSSNKELQTLLERTLKRLRKFRGNPRLGTRLLAQGEALIADSEKQLALIPNEISQCS